MSNVKLPDKPRMAEYAEYEGEYKQFFTVENPVIKPGEVIRIKHFFSGYGEILSAKVRIAPLSNVFDADNSYVISGFKIVNGVPMFRATKDKFTGELVLLLRGVKPSNWSQSTQFIDINIQNEDKQQLPIVITEGIGGMAPIEYELTTSRNCLPGNYYIDFVFTYFNGNKWCTDSKRIDFHVQNIFERYQAAFSIIALLASVSAIVRFGLIPLIEFLKV